MDPAITLIRILPKQRRGAASTFVHRFLPGHVAIARSLRLHGLTGPTFADGAPTPQVRHTASALRQAYHSRLLTCLSLRMSNACTATIFLRSASSRSSVRSRLVSETAMLLCLAFRLWLRILPAITGLLSHLLGSAAVREQTLNVASGSQMSRVVLPSFSEVYLF